MPLIEVKNFPKTSEFLEHLKNTSTEDLINSWIGSKPFDIFINRYKFRLIEHPDHNPLANCTGTAADAQLEEFIYKLNRGKSNIGLHYNFSIFLAAERDFLNFQNQQDDKPQQTEAKTQYLKFLDDNSTKLRRISNLQYKILDDWSKLDEKLNALDSVVLLRPNQLEGDITDFFSAVDGVYELFEKSFKSDSETPLLTKEIFPVLDWEYLRNPFQLNGATEDLIIYYRAIIARFKEKLYKRKKVLYWTKTPNTYLFVEEFIKELEHELVKLNKPQDTENESKVIISMELKDYPKYIFSSQKSYDFFCELVKFTTMPMQISFVFRRMSEIENPPLIVTKDVPFREWFNKQSYDIKLESVTSTYNRAASKDKIWLYSTVKLLLFKE